MKIRIITGFDIYAAYAVRIEIDDYDISLTHGKKVTDCTPYYGIEFNDYDKEEIISTLKSLLLRLMKDHGDQESEAVTN